MCPAGIGPGGAGLSEEEKRRQGQVGGYKVGRKRIRIVGAGRQETKWTCPSASPNHAL